LGSRAHGHVAIEGDVIYDEFRGLDVDGDESLTELEFLAGLPGDDAASAIKHSTRFLQADIDDDGKLGLVEYQFASYIKDEVYLVEFYEQVQDKLPDGFLGNINQVYWDLRATSPGKVEFDTIIEFYHRFLDFDSSSPEAIGTLRGVFDFTDVIRDGTLNLHELELFHFIVRDSLVDAALNLGLAVTEEQQSKEVPPSRVIEVFHGFDQDGDGLLDEREAAMGLRGWLGDGLSEEDCADFVRGLFQAYDTDRDKRLCGEELLGLAELLNL